jgi:ketosteroid isomerase-like protein
MVEATLRRTAAELFAAFKSRDPDLIAPWLTEDVDWFIFAPVDIFPWAGHRRGRQAVVDRFRDMQKSIDVTRYDQEAVLVDGETAATLTRVSYVQRATRRTVTYRVAQFLRFRDGKLCQFRAIIDSLDAAEQQLGRDLIVSAA